jgi:hypothetical protein
VLVAVTGFGSVWRRRFSKNEHDPRRFARGAYFNTTGVIVNGQLRQRPQIIGYARFDGRGGFDPNRPSRMINRVFECAAPCVWLGQNKLFFKRILASPERPDGFLVVVRPEITGNFKIGAPNWRSTDSWLIAFSECREQQEAMLLMSAYGWIRTELGRFVLEPVAGLPWVGQLVLSSPKE